MSLKGNTAEFPIAVLVRLLGDQKKTGELTLRGAAGEGALGLADGRVVTAVFGDEVPIAALGAVFDLQDADFEFIPWNDAPPANLEGDLDELLRKAEDHRRWLAGVREVIPSDRTRFRLSERAADQGAVTFTSDRWRVVLAVNGTRDVNDIAGHLQVDRNTALDLLSGLVRDGVIDTIEPAAEPAPTPVTEEPTRPVESAPAPPPVETAPAPPPFEMPPVVEAPPPPPFQSQPPPPAFEAPPPPAFESQPPPAFEPPAPAEPEWSAPAPTGPEWGAPAPAAQDWAPAAPAEPAPEPPPAMDDRLAALFGPAPSEAPPSPPAADRWTAPATEWAPPQREEWTPAPEPESPPAVDPRLGALTMPPAPVAQPEAERVAPSTVNEWAPPAPVEAPPQRKGLFGRFRKEEAVAPAAAPMMERGAGTRAGKLAALSNTLLGEFNSGTYGKARIDDRIGSLLMRVDEQADPIDRPLPIVDDRLDVQALERVNLPEAQIVPYLALLVSTIYADAEKAFGRDKAKKGYRAAQQQVFAGDTSALAGPDLAGKLPKA